MSDSADTVDSSASSDDRSEDRFILRFTLGATQRLLAFGSGKSGVLESHQDDPLMKRVLEHYRIFNALPMPTKIIGTVQGNREPRPSAASSDYLKGQRDGISVTEGALRALTREMKEENYRRDSFLRNLEKQREQEALTQAKSLLAELEARREKKQNLPPLVCESFASKIVDCYKTNYTNPNKLVECSGVVNDYATCTKAASIKWLSEHK